MRIRQYLGNWMKLGIALIAIGATDIGLSLSLGIIGGLSLVRFVIDIMLILWGVKRVFKKGKRWRSKQDEKTDITY